MIPLCLAAATRSRKDVEVLVACGEREKPPAVTRGNVGECSAQRAGLGSIYGDGDRRSVPHTRVIVQVYDSKSAGSGRAV